MRQRGCLEALWVPFLSQFEGLMGERIELLVRSKNKWLTSVDKATTKLRWLNALRHGGIYQQPDFMGPRALRAWLPYHIKYLQVLRGRYSCWVSTYFMWLKFKHKFKNEIILYVIKGTHQPMRLAWWWGQKKSSKCHIGYKSWSKFLCLMHMWHCWMGMCRSSFFWGCTAFSPIRGMQGQDRNVLSWSELLTKFIFRLNSLQNHLVLSMVFFWWSLWCLGAFFWKLSVTPFCRVLHLLVLKRKCDYQGGSVLITMAGRTSSFFSYLTEVYIILNLKSEVNPFSGSNKQGRAMRKRYHYSDFPAPLQTLWIFKFSLSTIVWVDFESACLASMRIC